jgi:hypothetical protein
MVNSIGALVHEEFIRCFIRRCRSHAFRTILTVRHRRLIFTTTIRLFLFVVSLCAVLLLLRPISVDQIEHLVLLLCSVSRSVVIFHAVSLSKAACCLRQLGVYYVF